MNGYNSITRFSFGFVDQKPIGQSMFQLKATKFFNAATRIWFSPSMSVVAVVFDDA